MSLSKMTKDQIKFRREIVWRSDDGFYCVVRGPFPENFRRGVALRSLAQARNTAAWDIAPRPATTKSTYAKTLVELVDDNHNEYGEISP